MSSQTLLDVIKKQIDALEQRLPSQEAISFSHARFDNGLFKMGGTRVCDYMAQVKSNFAQLEHVVTQRQHQQVAFMAERLVNQIMAIQRELATLDLRKRNQKEDAVPVDLYHKLAQNQGYERRIIAMIKEKELLLSSAESFTTQKTLQQEIAAFEGRLIRCRQAMFRLERAIEKNEAIFG